MSLHLHSAQELSLLGHSLSDELSSLYGQLLTENSQQSESTTLLEDLEAMHRSLKEQESVKAYVQVIHRALLLRCVVASLTSVWPLRPDYQRSSRGRD